jgi:hypothetical protein
MGINTFKNPENRKTLTRTYNNILRETEVAKGYPGFPDNCIAIAQNGTGNYLVLLKQENNR